MRFVLSFLFIGLFSFTAVGKLPEQHFPVDAKMRVRVEFWKKVYTQITSKEAFVHDSEELSVIYETISFSGKSRRQCCPRF